MAYPSFVNLVEVGPRDGLQNEKQNIPTATKLELIRRLEQAGLRQIESAAFVSPKWVPQMADHSEVMQEVMRTRKAGVGYPVLVPNLKGFEAALAAGVEEIAIFAAASEAFSQKNINCSIAESLERFVPVIAAARAANVKVRGYVSCVVGCPYQGEVAPLVVADVAHALYDMGCYEVSLGDTIGVGTPSSVLAMLEAVGKRIPLKFIAGHYHDTYGMAIANIHGSLQFGISTFDSSVAGLGGCPYAAGASGNVATEDVVYLLNGLGIDCGVNLDSLVGTAAWISHELGRPPASRVSRAMLAKCVNP